MMQADIVDPTKVTRSALQNATTVAAMSFLRMQSLQISQKRAGAGGGKPGMGRMMM
ncbi:hypothetical protein AB1K89_01025 [Sporosarcina sp. 179-K 8C2 HS]